MAITVTLIDIALITEDEFKAYRGMVLLTLKDQETDNYRTLINMASSEMESYVNRPLIFGSTSKIIPLDVNGNKLTEFQVTRNL